MSVSACSLVWREGEQTRKSSRRGLLKWTFFVFVFFSFFFAALRDSGLLEMSCFSSMHGVVDGTSGERFLTITPGTFRISPVKYRDYFLVVFFLFFPRSRIGFPKKLDEKHEKPTSCP